MLEVVVVLENLDPALQILQVEMEEVVEVHHLDVV
jgi:hypothetical protein